jgi:UrcA family protein
MMYRIILTVLAVAGLAASPLSARAQPAAGQISVKVFYGDLDISRPAGKQTLLGRIRRASHQACDESHASLSMRVTIIGHCAEDAMANALDAIHVSGMRERIVARNNQETDR